MGNSQSLKFIQIEKIIFLLELFIRKICLKLKLRHAKKISCKGVPLITIKCSLYNNFFYFSFKNQTKASTSVNTEKNVNESSDAGLFESFNIFFLKLKDEARLFNYLCFIMLQKEKKSIAYVKQMETLNVGKLNFFTKELIYLYGLPNEIRYSDTNLSSAFQEINCLKNEMTDIERSSWLNSVNSYFEEFYSQFDILNFSSKWNEKGASFKSIISKSDHTQVQNNMKRNLEATKEDEHLNVKKMKFSQTSASPSKSLLGLSRKNNDNQTTLVEEIESSNQFISKNKIFSNKTVSFLLIKANLFVRLKSSYFTFSNFILGNTSI